MKKWIISIVTVLLLFAAGIGFYFWTQQEEWAIEDMLPEGSLIYVDSKNVAKNLKGFTASRLFRSISTMDVPLLLEKSGLKKEQIEQYENLKNQINTVSKNLLLEKFFGQEIVLAVYPVTVGTVGPKALAEAANSFTLVTRLESEAKFVEFMSRFLKTLEMPYTTEEVQYKKYKITNITTPALSSLNIKISYVRIKDFLVLGFGEEVSRRSVDVVTKARTSLAKDKKFLSIKSKFLENSQFMVYVDIETIVSKFKEQIQKVVNAGSADKNLNQQVERSFTVWAGFTSLGFSATYGEVITLKTFVNFDKNRMDPALRQIYSYAPMKNTTLDFVPQKSLAYQWNNFYDMNFYWTQVKQALADISRSPERKMEATPEEMIAAWEDVLKLNVERDILPVLGREQGWIFTDINFSGEFPLPELIFFIKITDQVKAENMINTWTKDSAFVLQSEDYKGVGLRYFSLPIRVDLQPGYCFLNDYLLLASDRGALKTVIDTQQKTAASLASDSSFQEVNKGLTEAANSVFFFRNTEFIVKVRQIVDWAGQWFIKKSEQMEAYRAGTKSRLDDLRSLAAAQEKEIKNLRERLKKLTLEKKELLAQPSDNQTQAQDLQTQIDSLQMDVAGREGDLRAEKQKIAELEPAVAELDKQKSMDAQLMKLYFEKGLYPILSGLESIRSIGAKMIFGVEGIESTMFLKVQ